MPIPEMVSGRVIYANNPLTSVICQLRFPPILLIDTELPAQFQEQLRRDYPELEEVNESTRLSLPDSIAQVVPKELRESLTSRGSRRFEFKSVDNNWSVSLAKDFVALEVKRYKRWEEFRERLLLAVNAFVDVYEPAYFSRIGLRYQNVIDRDNLGLSGTSWKDLLSGFILGALASDSMMLSVIENHGAFSLRLNDFGDFVRVQHGLGSDSEDKTLQEKYLLDNDFYTNERMIAEVQNVASKADEFNALNGRLFRWCIRERLHEAMGPQFA